MALFVGAVRSHDARRQEVFPNSNKEVFGEERHLVWGYIICHLAGF